MARVSPKTLSAQVVRREQEVDEKWCITFSSVDIATSEGPVNLSWPAIMKTIQEDPQDFYKMGGWTFLTGDGSDEEDSESSAESAFEASDLDQSESDGFSDSDGEHDNHDQIKMALADHLVIFLRRRRL